MRLTVFVPTVLSLVFAPPAGADADDLRKEAEAQWKKGDREKALEVAGKAIAADPKDVRGYLLHGSLCEGLRRHEEAVADFNKCLELDPQCVEALNRRGSELFTLGKFAESLADFDRYLELRPKERPGHWKRGITLYYAGKYDEGRRQFEGYEKVDTNDVENAVWHFLCAAKVDGLDKARKAILKIGKDARPPMMQVYDLYRGAAKPEDVFVATRDAKLTPEQMNRALFYAHLYLGLYYDVSGDKKRALEHMTLAAQKHRIDHYMWDVARVHEGLLRKELNKQEDGKSP
jgi:lipoprotein NlpI